MSKSNSGLFSGTTGQKKYVEKTQTASDIISSRTAGLDLREHPRQKSLTPKQRKAINKKIKNRTATKEEYKKKQSDKRFSERRKAGVNDFWAKEAERIQNGNPTRQWNSKQIKAILNGDRPKYKGKTIQGHHTYSASKYPHLANRGEVVFPATFEEHLYGWHGGNFRKSKPGKPISRIVLQTFKEE